MESFVANKMELLLRYSWSNSRGRKRGVKVKSGENAAGIVENVLARKRGCIGWWNGLDERMKKQVFCLVSKKATKVLATESVSCRNVILKDIRCNLDVTQVHRDHIFPTWEKTVQMISHLDPVLLDVVSTSSLHFSLANCISGLILLQELSASLQTSHHEVETRTLFFSSLASVNTFSDCMLRRVRELLLRLSTDFIKFELLDDKNAKSQLNTSEEKSGAGHTKGKKKGCRSKNTTQRKQHSVSNSAACQKPYEDHGFKLMDGCNQSNILEATPLQFDATNKMHSAVAHDYARVITKTETNHVKGSSDREALNVHTRRGNASTKSKKRKPKSKRPFAGENNEEDNAEGCSQVSAAPAPAAAFKTVGEENQRMQLQPSGHDHVKDQNLSAVSNVSQSLNPSVEDNCVKEPEADATRDACEGLEVQCAVEKASHSFASYGTCRENPDKGEVSDCILTSDLSARHADVPDNHDSNMDSSFTPDVSCCYDTGVVSMGKLGTSACSGDDADNRLECSTGSYFPQPKQERFTQTLPTEETVYLQNIQDANSHTSVNFGAGTLLNRRRNVSHSPPLYTQSLPVVTDRLHLDVGCTSHNNFGESVISIDHTQNSSLIEDKNRIASSRAFSMSFDWPPYGSTDRSHPSLSHNFDSGQVPVLHPSEHSTFPEYGSQCNVTKSEDEKATPIYERTELCETKNVDLLDDFEGHWFSEEEYETRPIAERDYSQFFGGGVMYWNTSDLSGLRFSRPPSLSSDDSSWARHEADLNRTIDDIIGLPGLSSSYGTSGLASPPAPPFCTQYDSVGSGVQSVCYAMPGTEVNGAMHHSASIMSEEEKICLSTTNQNVGAVDGLSRDALPGPILRPIIIPNLSRKNSRSDFMVNLDHNSPCIPRSRKDYPRIKRPPSPVVLCVPRAPRPPPPSPVGGDSRKMRGFPAVRSGSSSPRHWGTKNMYADEKSHAEDNVCVDGAEKFWPTCAGKCLTGTPLMQPVPGNLLQDRLLAISQLSMDQEHPDVAVPVQSLELQKLPELKLSLASIHGLLHDEIDFFCKKVGAENMMRKPYINWAVKRVSRSLQVLWPRSRAKMFGSNATGLALPSSDVDLVVCLPPVRNLEPIKEAGILEGRNGIKETCLQHAARYLANQEWVKSDSLKTIENTAIPLIMLVAEVHEDLIGCDGTTIHGPRVEDAQRTIKQGTTTGQETSTSESSISTCVGGDIDESIDMKSIRLDISFQSTTHTGLQTTELVRELTGQFPAAIPLALVLKQFLADRSLDHSYSGGLSSYCLVLLITRFLQHQHHKGRPVNHNLGSLLMDFFYFFGNVFDPRQMRISIRGSGIYMDRERGQSLDPLHIEDPLYPTNNVGRNCFRIHQCIKAFSDAYNTLETETANLPRFDDGRKAPPLRLLPMIIPTINGKSICEG